MEISTDSESNKDCFNEFISLYETTCAKVNMMGHNESEEERNLSESMELCKIRSRKVKKESSHSKEECNYEGSTEMSKDTSQRVEIEDSAESQEIECFCTELVEVTSEKNGAQIIFANDDFYGIAENLLKDDDPVCNEHTIFDFNNVDGWKTQNLRKNQPNFAIIQLAGETVIHFICIDTASFIDSFISMFYIQGGKMRKSIMNKKKLQIREDRLGESCSTKDYTQMQNMTKDWKYLIPLKMLNPGYPSIRKKFFRVPVLETVTHLRVNIFPCSGIARLRAYGEVMPTVTPSKREIDLISSLYNSSCILFSDIYIGHPNNIIQPNKATSKIDGWITVRKHDIFYKTSCDKIMSKNWAVFKLGLIGKVTRVLIDTSLFTGNAPNTVRMHGGFETKNFSNIEWQNIIPQTQITPGKEQNINVKENDLIVNYVKIIIEPDGGICRFRVFGIPICDA